jgi:hypothetical protein
MRTVTAFEARRTAGHVFSGEMSKLSASPPRGAIGAGLFLLVSLFLLAAGSVAQAPVGDDGASRDVGVFLLDPLTTPARS